MAPSENEFDTSALTILKPLNYWDVKENLLDFNKQRMSTLISKVITLKTIKEYKAIKLTEKKGINKNYLMDL